MSGRKQPDTPALPEAEIVVVEDVQPTTRRRVERSASLSNETVEGGRYVVGERVVNAWGEPLGKDKDA